MITISEKLFTSFNVSEKDLEMYRKVLNGKTLGKEEKIISHFMDTYVKGLNKLYTGIISMVLTDSLTVDIPSKVITQNILGFRVASKYYEKTLISNYNKVAELVSGSFFDRYHIKNREMVKALRSEVFGQFADLTKNTMSMTDANILKHVRTLQREMIQRTLQVEKLRKMDLLDSVIEKEKTNFKKNMLSKYPELDKALNDGMILKSKPWIDKNEKLQYRTYTLDDYTEMSISRTLLNLDSTSSQVDAMQNGERVVEYYLRDNRRLVTEPFPLCQTILKHRVQGKSILALDSEAGKILEIMTVDEAKAEGAMAIWHKCRHSTKRIDDKNYMNMINKILYLGSMVSNKLGTPIPAEA